MQQQMTFRRWLLRLLKVGGQTEADKLQRQRARERLLCEIEQLTRSAKDDGKNH